ncbi:MAG: universal stress protein [Rhodomicrobium sp.]
MIKDILLRLDDADIDGEKLKAVAELASLFNAHVTGLFFNVIPSLVPVTGEPSADLLKAARARAYLIEGRLKQLLEGVGQTEEIRQFEVFPDEVTGMIVRECRAADVFLTQGAEGDSMQQSLIEDVLFQSGRHLIIVPRAEWPRHAVRSIVIGWNETREAARAVGEALPYLYAADTVTIVAVINSKPLDGDPVIGISLQRHLQHHGIHAVLHHVIGKEEEVADRLLAEAKIREAGLIVIGGYSHSRIREWLLGGVTKKFLRHSPVPLLIAH